MHDNQDPTAQKVELSDGTIILMEVGGVDDDGPVSAQEMQIAAKRAFSAISSLATDIKATLAKAKPDRASAEFSVELEKKNGDILSKICNVSGKGGIKFTLEWEFKPDEKK